MIILKMVRRLLRMHLCRELFFHAVGNDGRISRLCGCGRIGRKRHRILLAERLCPCSEFLENGQNHLFIAREHAWKGMGKLCFDRLEADARQMGMENIIAEISLETA